MKFEEKIAVMNKICEYSQEILKGKHIKGDFGYEECKKAIEWEMKRWNRSLQEIFEKTMNTYSSFTNIIYLATLNIMILDLEVRR